MTRPGRLLARITAFATVALASASAMASTFSGELPVGYSDSVFQISPGASSLVININAFGIRDPSICASCYSIYTDNYTVNFFNTAGTLLASANEINYLYYNLFSSSHGIGAGPVGRSRGGSGATCATAVAAHPASQRTHAADVR